MKAIKILFVLNFIIFTFFTIVCIVVNGEINGLIKTIENIENQGVEPFIMLVLCLESVMVWVSIKSSKMN